MSPRHKRASGAALILALILTPSSCGYRMVSIEEAKGGEGQPMAWVKHQVYVAPVIEEVPAGIGPALQRQVIRELSAQGVAVSSRAGQHPVLKLRVLENENTRNNNLDVLRETFKIRAALMSPDGAILWGPVKLEEQEQFSEAPVEGTRFFRTDRALFAEGQRAAYLRQVATRLSTSLVRQLQDDHLAQLLKPAAESKGPAEDSVSSPGEEE